MSEAKKPSRATTMRRLRDADGWARVDLQIPPGKALDALNRLTKGNKALRVEALLELLERA